MFFIKQHRWLYLSLSILSLCLAMTITPARASLQVPTTSTLNVLASTSQATNWLEQGRNLYPLRTLCRSSNDLANGSTTVPYPRRSPERSPKLELPFTGTTGT
jgi:hypothetical protein